MLKLLRDRLRELWTNEEYSPEFNAYPALHRDFDHALKHVQKPAQKLQNMCEEADHAWTGMTWSREEIEKYLADIIISAVRAAEKAPCGRIDLEKAIRERIKDKMKADL